MRKRRLPTVFPTGCGKFAVFFNIELKPRYRGFTTWRDKIRERHNRRKHVRTMPEKAFRLWVRLH